MSYMGVITSKNDHNITAKLHGPIDTFVVSPADIRHFINEWLVTIQVNGHNFNMVDTANNLSKALADKYCNGQSILWTEVIVESPNSILYNAVTEGV